MPEPIDPSFFDPDPQVVPAISDDTELFLVGTPALDQLFEAFAAPDLITDLLGFFGSSFHGIG